MKLLHELEKYLGNLDKEPDGGLSIMKDMCSKLDVKSSVLKKDPATVSPTSSAATLKKRIQNK